MEVYHPYRGWAPGDNGRVQTHEQRWSGAVSTASRWGGNHRTLNCRQESPQTTPSNMTS
jgi:hypothetical protein